MIFLEQLINGLNTGSIYALIALGYTMVYGIAKMLNFAHGDVIMVSGYVLIACLSAGMQPIIALLVTVLACVVLGVVIEKVAYKPLRKASPLTVLITAIGVSYLLQSVALLIYGSNQKKVGSIIDIPSIEVAGIVVTGSSIATLGVTIIIMIGLMYFINRTKIGKAMLAVSEDKGAAQLMGINVDKTISITFAIGSALAAIAGALYFATYTYVDPYTGSMIGIKAFVAAVLGGIGSIPGAMIGGILLGVIESLSKAYISTALADAIVFSVLIIVLLVKPSGVLGRIRMEKV